MTSYDIVVHNVRTTDYQFPKNTPRLSKHIVEDNAHTIPRAKITYIGWLNQSKARSQKISSIVIQFTEDRHANTVYRKGLTWDELHRNREKYDRVSKIVRCFKCQKSEHITPQCKAAKPTCAHCAQDHDSRQCEETLKPGITPNCANCKSKHPAFDSKCPIIMQIAKKAKTKRQLVSTTWPKYDHDRPPETPRSRPPGTPLAVAASHHHRHNVHRSRPRRWRRQSLRRSWRTLLMSTIWPPSLADSGRWRRRLPHASRS